MPKPKPRSHSDALPNPLIIGLNAAYQLMDRQLWLEAQEKLEKLDRRFPNREPVLDALLDICYELNDCQKYQTVGERLAKLIPDDPDLLFSLGNSYALNMRPVLAVKALRNYLEKFPQHEHADQARAIVKDVEANLSTLLGRAGIIGDDAVEFAAWHEQALALIDQGKYAQARRIVEKQLSVRPDFVPALNNLSQIWFTDGNLEQAIATAERGLSLDSTNFHALSNLTRYCFLRGQTERARHYAEQLKAVDSKNPDSFIKQAEALVFLGDNQGVLDAFACAEKSGAFKPPFGNPLLIHLAAVVTMRLGNDAEAKRLWQRALKIAPGFDLAQENLDDLKKPVGEQHAPWAFALGNWLREGLVHDLNAAIQPVAKRGDEAITRAVQGFLQQHSEMLGLVPALLDRGDPRGREFALRFAAMAKTTEMLAALHNFALSQRGPDNLRWEAARVASGAGLIEQPVRMWMHGKWQELLLLDYEMHDEPSFQHPPHVAKLLEQSVDAMHAGETDRAEKFVRQGLAIEPDAPDLLNNLAAVYEQRGQMQESEALLRQIFAKHPDYGFPRINLARMHIRRGELDHAEELLKPLLSRKRFHFAEFGFFCNAQIELFMARKNQDAARSWLGMWEGIDPEHPAIWQWKVRLEGPGALAKMLRRDKPRRRQK